MSWEIALNALLVLTAVFAVGAFMQRKFIDEQHLLRGYLLAGKTLQKSRVINLLWSTSFSLNGMLYQVWLGYLLGVWGLLTQAAWALSFFWLAKYADKVRANNSLHEALGKSFQHSTRVIAGVFSVVGAMALIGWEVNVGKSTFQGLIQTSSGARTDQLALIFTAAVIFSCVLYTIIGGLRGNAIADLLQTGLKLLGFGGLIFLLFLNLPAQMTWTAAFPNFAAVTESIGLFGLVTNLAFSVVWQFVDMSAWQTVIAGAKNKSVEESKSSLRWGGIWVFVAPGIIGTVLGIMLKPVAGVDAGNVLSKAMEALPNISASVSLLLAVSLISCLMSMVDGLLIASGYALVIDIFKPGSNLDALDASPNISKSLITKIRFAFFGLAILGSFGITWFMARLGLSVFDILYLVVIPHLALSGPVFASLSGRRQRALSMWWALLLGAATGLFAVFVGTRAGYGWLVEGAGFFTILTSTICAFLISQRTNAIKPPKIPQGSNK